MTTNVVEQTWAGGSSRTVWQCSLCRGPLTIAERHPYTYFNRDFVCLASEAADAVAAGFTTLTPANAGTPPAYGHHQSLENQEPGSSVLPKPVPLLMAQRYKLPLKRMAIITTAGAHASKNGVHVKT